MFSVSGDSKNLMFGLPSFFGPKANIVASSGADDWTTNQGRFVDKLKNELSAKLQAIISNSSGPGEHDKRETITKNVDNKYGRIVWILCTGLTESRQKTTRHLLTELGNIVFILLFCSGYYIVNLFNVVCEASCCVKKIIHSNY